MATPESLQFVQFTIPLSKPPFCKSNPLWSSKPSGSISSFNASDSQRIYRPAAILSRSRYQIEAERNTTARTKAINHPLPLEKQSRANLQSKISIEASNTGFTLQRLEQPALSWARLQVNRTQSESGESQDGSRDQSVILDNSHNLVKRSAGNEAGDVSSDCDTGHIKRVASLHDTFTPSELAFEPHGVPSTPAQAQPNTLPQSFKPLQDQINKQGVDITQHTSVDSALPSIAKASDSGDDGWNDADTAELEKELELALAEQQVESLSAGTSTIPSPHSVEALQDEIQSRERETIHSILDELRDVTRHGSPAQDLECYEHKVITYLPANILPPPNRTRQWRNTFRMAARQFKQSRTLKPRSWTSCSQASPACLPLSKGISPLT